MKRFYRLAIASAIVGFGLGTLNTAQAATFTETASDQGWWAAEDGLNGPNSNDNINYVTGNIRGTDLRNYFKFDLGNLVGVSSATLQIQRFVGSGNPTETLGFFDVSTPPNVLSQKINSPNNTIYNDLGSGKNYGNFKVTTSGDSSEILSFALNSNAIADINARKGNFFSVGGALQGDLTEEYLFSESGGQAFAKLVVNTNSTPVPEPSALGGIMLAGIGGWWLRECLKSHD
ncbi:PEP-CTERM sorting domain-containing protein [Nostoc sp. NMS4]|uniref:PEP-CTERM sorting domain-containing protein n=1 Tax=Nostoc sp. NMS4 TaxID=2815390 RepID=UPI0025F29ACA|nr:PEP-CTERM sorting domain-containing protein [Nostoc sp. NMS4]MBN3922174.1 PEP-CTERM sorting domain-containing protein [Nostoc sp. NMS4]